MIDSEIEKKVQEWLSSNIDDATKNDLQELLQKDPQKLKDSFYKKLDFGTGGIRALVGVGTNRLNQYTIQMATQGLANHLKQQKKENIQVVIGYDNRIHSRFFAEQSARVLAANQIKVFIFDHLRPTPFISFACRHLKCSAAIMITASHNSSEYNGFKVYYSDGAQVLPPHDKKIIDEYYKIQKIDQVQISSFHHPLIEIIDDSLDNVYLDALQKIQIYPKQNKEKGNLLKIVYTNLHGTGIVLAPKAFQRWGFTQYKTVKKQEATDGHFPYAKNPNPEEKKALELGIEELKQTESDIFIANDPDADRMAATIIHEKSPVVLSGNQIACLLAYHICESGKDLPTNGTFIKSIVTSDLFQVIVSSYHFTCIDVLTGFKYIAEKIRLWEDTKEHTFIFGAEESYGYLKGDYTRDKDGIAAACLFAELALDQKLKKKTVLDLLYELYQKFGIYREGQTSLLFQEDSSSMQTIDQIMSKLRSNPPSTIGSSQVASIEDYKNQTRIDCISKKEQRLDLPISNVLCFKLLDDTKLIIRPSGTEPKIKIYAQVVEKKTDQLKEMIQKTDQRLQDILDHFKQSLQA